MLVSPALVRASILVICGIAVWSGWSLWSTEAFADPSPRPATTPILFDPRELFAQPLVAVEAFGRPRAMIIDTGSRHHVIGFQAAGISPDATTSQEAFG
ncbi:MAG TPA: hypothetical protein VIF57_29145, partial [Polyangia bacterium]